LAEETRHKIANVVPLKCMVIAVNASTPNLSDTLKAGVGGEGVLYD
jgi:hypothetical protein